MEQFGLESAHLWLIAGAVFLAIEAFGIPGLGFLFAGLAAIVTGILVEANVIGEFNYVGQGGWFLGLTTLFAALLWKKLKAWRTPSEAEAYNNIVGDTAIVGRGGLNVGRVGQAAWSGTTMMAEMSPDLEMDGIAEGEVVEIVDIKGSKLIVAPRGSSR